MVFGDCLGVIHDPQLVTGTEAAVLLNTGKMKLGVISVYLEGDQDIVPYIERSKAGIQKLRTNNIIIAGDVNAWSHWWGSSSRPAR